MAKPRIFISSTYYDLKYIRRSVEQFVESLGYEASVFESGDVPFSHDTPFDESCYREIGLCHVLVLIIGGRYGSSASEERAKSTASRTETTGSPTNQRNKQDEKDRKYAFYNSVTSKEYQTARDLDIPIYIFVEKGVIAEYETYKKNRNIELNWAHVDSTNIFLLLDDIFAQSRNNLVKEFATADDITAWLRDQWAGLFAHFISKRRDDVNVGQLKVQMESLTSVVNALKTYSEQIVRNVAKTESETIISNIDKELHARQTQSMLRNLTGLSHLIENHSVNAETVFQAFREATSFDDLFERLDKCQGEGGCLAYKEMLVSTQNEVNNARLALGLSSFEKKELGDLDFPYLRLQDIREKRSRELRTAKEREVKKTNQKGDENTP